jgi:CRP-like cAMP-binding protein
MAGSTEFKRRLSTIPLFSGLSKAEIDSIVRVAAPKTVPAGEVLCREGTSGHEFFLISDGEAIVTQRGRRLRRLGPGDFFGELALLDRGTRSATVRAEGPMTLYVIRELDFAALLDEVPALSHKLLATLASRLREAEARALA